MAKYRSNDFNPNDLPNNRWEQFKDIFKIEWRTLLYIGIFLLLTSLPLVAFLIYRNSFLISLKGILEENNIVESEQYLYLFLANIASVVIEFILSILLIIGLAGSQRVIRHLVWEEGVLFKRDIIDGIKKNFLSFFKISLLVFVIILVTTISDFLIALYVNAPADTIIQIVIDVFDIFIFLPMLSLAISMNTIYDISIKKTISNSFVLGMRYYLYNIPFILLFLGLYMAFYIPNIIVMAIVFIVLIALVLPIVLLGWYLVHINIYDKTINNSYKEYQYKGLYKPED